jgi:hypothetical protein
MTSAQVSVKWTGCAECGSNTTTISKGRPLWYHKSNGDICHRCYMRLYVSPRFIEARRLYNLSPKAREARRLYCHEHGIRFYPERKRVYVRAELPRTGLCSSCGRSVSSGAIKTTQLHHLAYDADRPEANVVELCVRCHRGIHAK